MPQLKIICLAHPAVWSSLTHDNKSIYQKMLDLKPTCQCWFNLSAQRGGRIGIYRVEKLARPNTVLLRFIAEADINEEHPSAERLLAEDNCLPKGVSVPTPIPRASKSFLFFDLDEGICYAYSPGVAPEVDKYFEILAQLEKDAGLFTKAAKIFEWKEELITTVTEEARKEGFRPYRVKADLETVKVTAEGDLETNENWKKIEGAVDLGTWKTVAYVRPSEHGMFIFGLTKRRSKQINMPEIEADLSTDEILERMLEIRTLIERALGCEVRQYCFPEPIKPLTEFL